MLFESEAYLENLDAEAQTEVLQSFQQGCELAVRQFDGTVVQSNEQGVLVCFGYPVAFEDAAQCAAKAGLGLLAAMKVLARKLRGERDLDLDPWVGIHTGPAVVEMVENRISLVGEARNVVLRLQDAAQSGQVVCSKATERLIRERSNALPSVNTRSRVWRSPSRSSGWKESRKTAARLRRRVRLV